MIILPIYKGSAKPPPLNVVFQVVESSNTVPKDTLDGMISRITGAVSIGGNKQATVAKFQGVNHDLFVQK